MDLTSELILKISTKNKAVKTRLSVAPTEELRIWGDAFEKLSEFGDLLEPYLKRMTIEELRDVDKLYTMAELIHDTLRRVDTQRRKDEADILLSMAESNIEILKKFITPRNEPEKVTEGNKETPKPTIKREPPSESTITSKLTSIRSSLDYFDIIFLFTIRDNRNIDEQTLSKIRESKNKLEEEYNLLEKEIAFSIPTEELREKWSDKLDSINRRLLNIYKLLDQKRSNIIPFNTSFINKSYNDYQKRQTK